MNGPERIENVDAFQLCSEEMNQGGGAFLSREQSSRKPILYWRIQKPALKAGFFYKRLLFQPSRPEVK